MAEIPEKAIDAVIPVFDSGIVEPRELALAILEAAEKVWPHDPPKRDPASATHLTTSHYNYHVPQKPVRAFGFSRDVQA